MTKLSIQQAFNLALGHHRAGPMKQAEALYRQILACVPNHADTTYPLGVLAH
jgi:hypothetical protein